MSVTGTLGNLTIPTDELYPEMVAAHKRVAEALAYHEQQRNRWEADGRPRGADGKSTDEYNLLPPMQFYELARWLERQYDVIKFIGSSVNQYVELSLDEYNLYTGKGRG